MASALPWPPSSGSIRRCGQDKARLGYETCISEFEELARDRFIIGDQEDCIGEIEKNRAPCH